MSSWDIAGFISCVAAFLVFYALKLQATRRRNKRLLAFAQRHGLRMKRRDGAVGPEIRGFIVAAIYPVWMEGVFEGVPVVAFDYKLGFGNNRKLGSGVGVQRRVMGAQHLAQDMESSQHDGWTFLYTPTRTLRRNDRLDPEEMEFLWRRLLGAPSRSFRS